jgi:hypothetical protein
VQPRTTPPKHRPVDLATIRQKMTELLADLKTFGEHDTAFVRKLLHERAAHLERMIAEYLSAR